MVPGGAAGLDDDRAAFYSATSGRGHRACVGVRRSRGETGTVAESLTGSSPLSWVPILKAQLALMLASALKHQVSTRSFLPIWLLLKSSKTL